MRVAHIAFQYGLNNTGGAAIAATRLHRHMLANGDESHYVCVHAREPGTNVHELPRGWARRIFLLLTKLTRGVWKLTPQRRSVFLNLVPLFGLEKLLAEIRPDVVHVQWINADVCSFEQLARLPYKVVFNLHDLFVLNAELSYPGADRRFVTGFDRTNSTWLERWLFNRKRKMVAALNPTFAGPSEWACEQCRNSLIGRGRPVRVLPNLVDPELAHHCAVAAATARPHTRFVILFGACRGRGNPTKGFDRLAKALELLPSEMKARTELRVFGESAADCETEGVKTRFLGVVTNPARMAEIYCVADVFAFPSREETQGLTKLEALLCGLPVVAFDCTACAEGIEHGKNGWIAPDGDFAAYAAGLAHYFAEWASGAPLAPRDDCMEMTG